jgi:hypothetical protein
MTARSISAAPQAASAARVRVVSRAELPDVWHEAFRDAAKDRRYYEIVADALGGQFECRSAVIEDPGGAPLAVQPLFFVEQDLVATAPPIVRRVVRWLRARFPRLLRLRMLMVGCAAGEGPPATCDAEALELLAEALPGIARGGGAALIVWKDAPARFRVALSVLTEARFGFARIASMPATRLLLRFTSFDDYLGQRLSHAARKDLRRKFRAAESAAPLEMSVVNDVSGIAEEVHALYLQVLGRSRLQFERLTPEFLLQLGQRMPDRARFFLWRQNGRLVACSICLVHDGAIYDEYLGLDYRVAHDLHLYFLTLRDVLTWAISQGLKTYHSTPLNYDPKRRLGFELAPLDLYVRPAALWLRPLLCAALPFLQPTRSEPVLRDFPNSHEL